MAEVKQAEKSYPPIKWRIRKVYNSLSEDQVRRNFEIFSDFKPGISSTRIDSAQETLPDGTRVGVGYILERIKPPPE